MDYYNINKMDKQNHVSEMDGITWEVDKVSFTNMVFGGLRISINVFKFAEWLQTVTT